MIYGYLRVSSDEQDVNSQKQGVEQFAKDKGWTIDKYIADEGISGGKDPSKRKLGPLLKLIQKDDIIICSEISRLGRDLYMVMKILNVCMERGCTIYTVKDRFVLGDDIQSKVLAFAFGLAAEIERKMIQQRTAEGLRLRMKQGVLLGRPIGKKTSDGLYKCDKKKEMILNALELGFSQRKVAAKAKVDRNTIARALVRWGVREPTDFDLEYERREKKRKKERMQYKDTPPLIVELDREIVTEMICQDLTIPQIADKFPQHTYEEIYDTISCDEEWNTLYRQHGQLKIKKRK